MITFFVRDWLVFYNCGAVEQCLVESSNYQNIAKFAVTAIMTVVVFFIGGNCLCKRDRNFLQAGFAMALCADFCLKISTRSGAPQRLHVAWHLLLYGRAGTFHLPSHTHKRYGQELSVDFDYSVYSHVYCKRASSVPHFRRTDSPDYRNLRRIPHLLTRCRLQGS